MGRAREAAEEKSKEGGKRKKNANLCHLVICKISETVLINLHLVSSETPETSEPTIKKD